MICSSTLFPRHKGAIYLDANAGMDVTATSQYTLTVTASDGELSDSGDVIIYVMLYETSGKQ